MGTTVSQHTDGSSATVEAYQNDEDESCLLRQLHDTALRFKEHMCPRGSPAIPLAQERRADTEREAPAALLVRIVEKR